MLLYFTPSDPKNWITVRCTFSLAAVNGTAVISVGEYCRCLKDNKDKDEEGAEADIWTKEG
jgi:hypothetical protein